MTILEDYFDFLAPDDIRLKGHRIGIEHVLYQYIHRAQTPEEIIGHFPSLTLDKVHATILYYLLHRQEVDTYLTNWLDGFDAALVEQQRNPSPLALKLRALKAEREEQRQDVQPGDSRDPLPLR